MSSVTRRPGAAQMPHPLPQTAQVTLHDVQEEGPSQAAQAQPPRWALCRGSVRSALTTSVSF